MERGISFIGVGPGDPDLLTVKALKEIKSADVIFWTDSLIPEKIICFSDVYVLSLNQITRSMNTYVLLLYFHLYCIPFFL